MDRQARRKNKRMQEWFASLSQDKYDLIEKVVDVRVKEIINATNGVLDTSFAAALADVYEDITIEEREHILDLAYAYILEAQGFLMKYKEGWIKELKKHEKEIKARIAELLKDRTVKSKGMKILKKEFEEIPVKDLSNMWIEVKEDLNIHIPVYSLDVAKNATTELEVKEHETIKIKEPKSTKDIKKEAKKIIEEIKEIPVVKFEEENKMASGLKLKVLKATIEGEFGTYEKEGKKVTIGDLTFDGIKELEAYKDKELALFMARIREAEEVMNMGV